MLKSPYPYFGGKSKVAQLIWARFGDVKNFVEPFFGSGAVLLARENWEGRTETINDKNCYISNFWRAVRAEPETVAEYADYPVVENDLHSRHLWLVNKVDFRERMMVDPNFYDCQVAGWWVWGASCWIGSGWCDYEKAERQARQIPELVCARGEHREHQEPSSGAWPHLTGKQGIVAVSDKRPHLMSNKGVNRQLPWVTGDQGVNRQLPHVGNAGRGVHRAQHLLDYLQTLADRLRRVRVCCGDWARVCTPAVTFGNGLTGVLLDPPYSAEANRGDGLYAAEDYTVAHVVREWCLKNGHNRLLRIAYCSYDNEIELFPANWTHVRWKTNGGYGNQSNGKGAENRGRECVFFSPHCLGANQLSLLEFDGESAFGMSV